jgi:ABC-type multidrug transport system fused ATPase/permease subunit
LAEGRTALIVAHRLNTARGADRIVVMEDGRVVGAGVHEDLLRCCSLYARLLGTRGRVLA